MQEFQQIEVPPMIKKDNFKTENNTENSDSIKIKKTRPSRWSDIVTKKDTIQPNTVKSLASLQHIRVDIPGDESDKLAKFEIKETKKMTIEQPNALAKDPSKGLSSQKDEDLDNPQEFETDMEVDEPPEPQELMPIKPSTPLANSDKCEKVEEEKNYEGHTNEISKSDNGIVLALDPVEKPKPTQTTLKEQYINRLLYLTRLEQQNYKCM